MINFNVFKKKMKEGIATGDVARQVIKVDDAVKKVAEDVKKKKEEEEKKANASKELENEAAEILASLIETVKQATFFGKEEDLRVMNILPSDIVMYYKQIEEISQGDLKGVSKIVFDFLQENGYRPCIEIGYHHRAPCTYVMNIKERDPS